MTLGHGVWGGLCPGGQSRVCAYVAHIAYVYSRCVPPVASLPTRHLVFPRTPVLSLSFSPACFSVRDLPAMESASRRVLRSHIAETPLTMPSAGLPTVMPSAGTPITAMPSAGTPATPSAGTPSADSPLVPKAEPDIPPGPIAAPSHDVALKPPT